MKELSRKVYVGNSSSVPNRVPSNMPCYVSSLNQIHGYSFTLHMLQDRVTRQYMVELLTVISWSSPDTSSPHLDSQRCLRVSAVEKPRYSHHWYLSRSLSLHLSVPTQGALSLQHHRSCDLARRLLGHLDKTHRDSLEHCWHWQVNQTFQWGWFLAFECGVVIARTQRHTDSQQPTAPAVRHKIDPKSQ